MSKTLFPILSRILNTIKSWPFDKQLTLLFPSLIIAISLFTGSWQAIEVNENKMALFFLLLFTLLILIAQPLLSANKLTIRQAWFLHEFWPVPAILLGYLLMRILRLELAIEFFNIPQQDPLMIALDQKLFGQTLPLYIQHWINPSLTWLMETAYLHFYYLLPIGSLIFFYWREQEEKLIQLRKAIIYTLVGGFCSYFLLPVKGPIDFMPELFTVPLKMTDEIVYDAVNSFRFAYDCFPSLHTATPWVVLMVSWPWHTRAIRTIMLAMTLAITLSTLYLRYHYGFDVLAGLFWAFIVSYALKTKINQPRFQPDY
jgi:membrane-associated phospholipid phosphatase